MSANAFVILPKNIKQFIDGKVDRVLFVKDNLIPRDEVYQVNEDNFGGYVQQIAKEARKEFDQELEKKLAYLVEHCGTDVLKHIRVVMDPYSFRINNDVVGDMDNFHLAITTQARLEYFTDVEVVDG